MQMARKPESLLRDKIFKRLDKLPDSYWEKIEQISIRGTADIVGCFMGIFYWIEVKMEFSEKIAEREHLQLYKMGEIIKAGGAGLLFTEKNWKHHCDRLEMKWKRQKQLRVGLRRQLLS